MDDDVNQETVDVEEPDEYVAHYQSSEIYSHSPDGATNPYCNHHSTDDTTEQGAEYEAFCVLSKTNDPLEGPTNEPTKSKGPKKWNDVLRRHLVKKGRKKEQTDDSRKSFADVISGSIQKFFGRSSTYDEKEKYPETANGFDSNSTTDDNMQSDHQQQRNLANGDEEEEEEVDSDEMMWSDNEFDDDDFYANVDDFGEVENKQNDEMEEEEVRQTQPIQVTSQSTQISTQATQVQTTEVFTPLSPLDAELDQVTTHSTQSPNERHLVEDSQVVYEFLDFRDYTISDDKIDDKKHPDNDDYIVDNLDLKSECIDLTQSKENDLVHSDSQDADKTTLEYASDNSSSVKFNALLRNFNKTEDNSANAGINSSRLTRAEFNKNGVRSVLTNGERTDYSRVNRLEKQEPIDGRRSFGCLNSEKINRKWIPSKPADACVTKPGVTYLTKPNTICVTKPNVISDKTQSVSYVTDPTITNVRRPSITSVTKSSELSGAKQNVICVTRPIAINVTKPDITYITKPSVTSTTTKPSVNCSTTQANVTGLTKPGVSVLTKPSVTYASTKPSVTYATTKPSVTYATTKPIVNCSTPPSVTGLTKSCVTSVTTKPSVICATTKPSVTVLTKPSVTCATTKLSFTCATTKPSITSSTTKPSITSSTTKPDATSVAKPSVVDCSEKPTVSAKERAVMFASLGAKKTDLHGRNLEELERISHQSNDTTCASGQSKTDTSRTQSPNIFSKIRLFENNKHPEKSSNQIGSNTKTTGLQDGDCGSNEGSKAASPAVLKKPNPMSDQRSFFTAKGTSGPPPLPVRKCPGSSNGPSGKTLPAKGGLAFMDWAQQDAPLVTSSRRRPPLPENDAPTDFYLAPADSATEAVKTTDDVDDVIVAYVDDLAFLHSTSVKAKSQPLPPLPKGQPSKPKTQAGSIGSHGGPRWTGASTNEQKEHAETKISGGRSSVPTIPSVPRPPLPFRKFSEASTVTGGQTIATDVNFNELEEVKRNLGKKPGRISSERDQPFAGAPLSKPPLPPAARTSASEKDKKWKTWTGLPSENSTTNGMDELISALEQKSWYHGDLSRKECETLILSEGQNGRFVVRRRCDDVDGYPYALSIQHNNKMHNVLIRRRTDNTFALGNEKTNENVFNDIMEMVSFHRNNPIILSNNIKVTLTSSPTRR